MRARAAAAALLLAACTAAPSPSPAGDEATAASLDATARVDALADLEALLARVPLDQLGTRHALGVKWNWSRLDELADVLAPVGGGTSFLEVEWCDVEPVPGERDWTRVDRILRRAAAMDAALALKLRVGACWATGDVGDGLVASKAPSSMPLDAGAHDAFLADAVRRYAPRGVTAFAVENEVGARTFWTGSPEEYADLLVRSAATLREAAPGVRVLDSGLDSVTWGLWLVRHDLRTAGPEAAAERLASVFARRATTPFAVGGSAEATLGDPDATRRLAMADATLAVAEHLDALQLHWYEPVEHLPDLLEALRAELPADVAIEAWEVGIAWADAAPAGPFDADLAGMETTRLVVELLRAGAAPVVWLPEAFTPGGRRPDELWRGLWEPDGTPRPGAGAFTALVEATSGLARVDELPDDLVAAGARGAVLRRLDGSATTVLWSDASALTIDASGADAVTDHLGRALAGTADRVAVGAAPVLVVGAVPALAG